MKAITFTLCLLITLNCFSQDWALFPNKVDMYYLLEGTTTPYTIKQDSVFNDGATTHYFFNKISPEGTTQECYDSMLVFTEETYGHYTVTPKEYLLTADSILHYMEDFGSYPAIFKPWAQPGEGWFVVNNSLGSDTDSIQIICDSTSYGSFLGVSDSLKYFSVHNTASYIGTNNIENISFILSKQHGLLRFAPLHLLLIPSDCPTCYKCYNLIGWYSNISSGGYIGPIWENFIQLSPGDFLKFRHTINAELYSDDYYVTQLIESVDHYADSIVVNYINAAGLPLHYTYYKDIIYNTIKSTFKLPTRMPLSMFTTEQGNSIGSGINTGQKMDTITFPGNWILNQSISEIGYIDETECLLYQPFETAHIIGWDTYIGNTYAYHYNNAEINEYTLVGYIISGQPYGDYWPLTFEEQIKTKEKLLISPNPAINQIQLQISFNSKTDIYIYDIYGQLKKYIPNSKSTIDISDLSPGSYIVQFFSDHKTGTAKLIKTEN